MVTLMHVCVCNCACGFNSVSVQLMQPTVEHVVSLRHALAVCLAPCITPSCPQAMWEAVSSQDRKLFQPCRWPNICSGFHE